MKFFGSFCSQKEQLAFDNGVYRFNPSKDKYCGSTKLARMSWPSGWPPPLFPW